MSNLEASCSICFRFCGVDGDHQVSCGGNNDRIICHNSLWDTLLCVAQSAAFAPCREVPFVIPGSCNRPADLYLPVWKCAKPAALDITVISPLQQLTLANAAAILGSVLLEVEQRKCAAYADACAAVGISFPLWQWKLLVDGVSSINNGSLLEKYAVFFYPIKSAKPI